MEFYEIADAFISCGRVILTGFGYNKRGKKGRQEEVSVIDSEYQKLLGMLGVENLTDLKGKRINASGHSFQDCINAILVLN